MKRVICPACGVATHRRDLVAAQSALCPRCEKLTNREQGKSVRPLNREAFAISEEQSGKKIGFFSKLFSRTKRVDYKRPQLATATKTTKEQIAIVEGTEVPYTKDIEMFILLSEKRRMAAILLKVSKYKEIVKKLLNHYENRFGLYSDFAMASTDMRLLCPKCGNEYGGDQLLGLAGAGKHFKGPHYRHNSSTGTFSPLPPYSEEQHCLKCGHKDALFFYDMESVNDFETPLVRI